MSIPTTPYTAEQLDAALKLAGTMLESDAVAASERFATTIRDAALAAKAAGIPPHLVRASFEAAGEGMEGLPDKIDEALKRVFPDIAKYVA